MKFPWSKSKKSQTLTPAQEHGDTDRSLEARTKHVFDEIILREKARREALSNEDDDDHDAPTASFSTSLTVPHIMAGSISASSIRAGSISSSMINRVSKMTIKDACEVLDELEEDELVRVINNRITKRMRDRAIKGGFRIGGSRIFSNFVDIMDRYGVEPSTEDMRKLISLKKETSQDNASSLKEEILAIFEDKESSSDSLDLMENENYGQW